MVLNNLTFLSALVQMLQNDGMNICVFGGWAEQLLSLRQPGYHTDIDLLIRAVNFNQLESFMSDLPMVTEIPEKHFSHKRAFEWNGVRIEFILVKPNSPDVTILFDGRMVIQWPADTFSEFPIQGLPVASEIALNNYRQHHEQMELAYGEYLNANASNG